MEFNLDLGKVGLTVGGAWDSESSFERLHIITHNDGVYVSLKDNKGVEPGTDDTVWRFLVSSGGGGTVIQGDVMTVAYSDGKLYWKKNGQWMKDPDGNMVPVGAAASEVVTSDNDIELKYSSITSPGNPSDNPNYWVNAGNANTIWMAVRLKRNGVWGGWSILKVKGADGQPGQDGADATSIGFKGSFSNPNQLPSNPETGDAYIFTGTTATIDGKTWTTGHLFVWDGDSWADVGQIQGPAGQNNFVYVAFSDDNGVTLTGNNGTVPGKYFGTCVTSSSTRPTTASSYTWVKAQGEDGFGYEFIFKLTADLVAPEVPTSVDEDEYQPTGWTDDQDDVTEQLKYCWQCYRMKKNGHWGNYIGSPSNTGYATLVARWGRDGQNGLDGTTPTTHYKSIVFTRTNTTPSTPTGGSYESPIPEDVDGGGDLIWSDGIPDGQEKVWSSSNVFHSDGTSDGWTEPQPMTDTDTYDVEFARKQANDGYPATPSNSNRHGGSGTQVWFDPDLDSSEDFTNMYWRAERRCINGEWGSWTIVRIKGEKGDAGTSITILGTKSSVAELPDEDNTVGDSWLVDGDLYIWDGDSWENAGQLQGPAGVDGQTPFLHIKYGTKVGNNIVFTGNSGETPGDYIGIYWDYTLADSSDPSDYRWSYCKGEDGFGYEYIFTATPNKEAPVVPPTPADDVTVHGKHFQDDDFVPEGWSDDMPDLNDTDKRFRWKCWRKKVDGIWGAFQGSSSNPGYAILDGNYALDGQQGNGITEVTEYYAISADGVNPPTQWSATVQTPTEQKKFLWNYEVVHYTNGDGIPTPPCVIGVYGSGKGISSVVEMYLATTVSAGITRNTSGWTSSIQTISATKPFLWNYEIINFTDGSSTETEPVVIGHFGANGSPGTDGLGIKRVDEYYAANNDPSHAPTFPVNPNVVPALDANNKYLWNRERVIYTDDSYVDTPACIIGVFGEDGAAGRGISQVIEFYLASANAAEQNDIDEDGRSTRGWTTTVQTITEDKPFLWNLERIVFTDGTYQDTYPVVIGIYTISALSTYAYLKAIFGEDHVTGEQGALLQSLIGVIDDDERCVAMINASAIGKSSVHGKLMIAAGMTNVSAPNSAKFKVYEDGHVEMYDCKVVGDIEAKSLTLADPDAGTKIHIGADSFQPGDSATTITAEIDSLSEVHEVLYSYQAIDEDIHEANLGLIEVPASGGVRLHVPAFSASVIGGGNMVNTKFKFRMFMTLPNGSRFIVPDSLDGGVSPGYYNEASSQWSISSWFELAPGADQSDEFSTEEYIEATGLTPGLYGIWIVYQYENIESSPGYETGTLETYVVPADPGVMTVTTSSAEVRSLKVGGNGFQISLGAGWYVQALQENGKNKIFLSCRTRDNVDCWISLSEDGIKIKNTTDRTERLL